MRQHSRTRLVVAAVAATGGALLAPGAALALTKQIQMGTPPSVQPTLQRKYLSDANAFFPTQTTIHAGDSVQFVPSGFHTVEFPATGKRPIALFAPTGKTIAGSADAAGSPFWFNGQPELGFAPQLLTSAFGKKQAFTAAKGFQTGLPLANRPKPATLTFNKTGSYTYYCNVHPGMKGSVRVVAKGRAIPSKAAHAKRVKAQSTAATKVAAKLAAAKGSGTTVSAGLVGAGGVEYFDFKPNAVSVPVGGQVTFTMPKGSTETHT
ncbi:MAG: hypothetical protein JWO02_1826, partial [Solirubrobacterales bacterium]|nr:hypothetical protein [Solirubrobacterales bacterium]